MNTQSIDSFCQELINRVYTTDTLKILSDTLEELSQNQHFKLHAAAIINDSSLTTAQKRAQLLYLIRSVEVPLLYDFFSDTITAKNFWLFDNKSVDYFDQFVQSFQMATEELDILFLTTSVNIDSSTVKAIANDVSKSFNKKVILKHEINPAIMGGAVARMGNLVFDLSLRTRFNQFERHWLSTLERTSKEVGRFEIENPGTNDSTPDQSQT